MHAANHHHRGEIVSLNARAKCLFSPFFVLFFVLFKEMKRCSVPRAQCRKQKVISQRPRAVDADSNAAVSTELAARAWSLGGGEGRMGDENDTSSFHSIVKESHCAI